MKSILDPEFIYTSSVNTDLRKTFARIRADAKGAANGQESEVGTTSACAPEVTSPTDRGSVVTSLVGRTRKGAPGKAE